MAYSTDTKLSRNTATLLHVVTSAASTFLDPGSLAASLAPLRIVSSAASTISSANAGSTVLYVPIPDEAKIGFLVGWACTDIVEVEGRTATLTVEAGDSRGAWQSDLGSLTITAGATDTTGPMARKYIVGPFEGARFARSLSSAGSTDATGTLAGQRFVLFTPHLTSSAGAAASFNILPFTYPSVQYDT